MKVTDAYTNQLLSTIIQKSSEGKITWEKDDIAYKYCGKNFIIRYYPLSSTIYRQ